MIDHIFGPPATETNNHNDTRGRRNRRLIRDAFRWAALARRRSEDRPDHKALAPLDRGLVIRSALDPSAGRQPAGPTGTQ